MVRVDSDNLPVACAELSRSDEALAALYTRNGPPPLWERSPGFPTLVRLILEQQVSLASGRAAFDRLQTRLGEVTATRFLPLDDEELRAVGFSRQKTKYVRLLAEAVVEQRFRFGDIGRLDDDRATASLLSLTGVGPWTAANYLLFADRRADAWPRGDRALVVSLGRALRTGTPSDAEADAMAERWRPWRAVAARMLWHDYLGGRAYDPARDS